MYFPFTPNGPNLINLPYLSKEACVWNLVGSYSTDWDEEPETWFAFVLMFLDFLGAIGTKEWETKQNTKPRVDCIREKNTVFANFKIYMMHEA